jgi:hypothetical protein
MAVVINEFEVMPQTPAQNEKASAKKADEKGGAQKSEMSDHDVKKILERRAERMERVAAH